MIPWRYDKKAQNEISQEIVSEKQMKNRIDKIIK